MVQIARNINDRGEVLIPGSPVSRFLFRNRAASWLWLLVRVWVGWKWLSAGWGKLNNPAWMDGSGQAIAGFWQRAVAIPEPPAHPAITYGWYRDFLQFLINTGSSEWFSYVIVFGELAVGLGLILGVFVGLTAAGGLTMNLSYMLAGSASTNPVLAILAILLILAWRNAGYLGLDRYLLPAIGTPWWRPRCARSHTPGNSVDEGRVASASGSTGEAR